MASPWHFAVESRDMRDTRQSEQAPTRSHSWPKEKPKRAARGRPRSPVIRVEEAWEFLKCTCDFRPLRVKPILKCFDREFCEYLHRCAECLKPAQTQTPTAEELGGRHKIEWFDIDKMRKEEQRLKQASQEKLDKLWDDHKEAYKRARDGDMNYLVEHLRVLKKARKGMGAEAK